jgi:deazaflavin-dependent oxidoreductase (nitroreductase family)
VHQRRSRPPLGLLVLLALPLLAPAVAALSVRLRLHGLLRWVRRFNRAVFNRAVVRLAGRRGAPIALVRHRGRRSGRDYTTPVVAVRAGEQFFIALTYGPGTDWCRNVLAAGGATLIAGGIAYAVRAPEIAGQADALPAFPLLLRLGCRLLGIREFLALTAASSGPS